MKVLVKSYCGVVFVAFKATELYKTCFDYFVIIFFARV